MYNFYQRLLTARPFRILLALSIWGLLSALPAAGQEEDNTLPTVNIMSPNAAALGKYVDFPVSYHTGVPNISLPLYEIQEGPLRLPISLNYHAGGLKVMEMASWVGAGWSLSAGGAVSRTVKGLPDEFVGPADLGLDARDAGSYYRDGGYSSYFLSALFPGDEQNDYEHFGTGIKDGEPDLFFFNFAGTSGKFYINEARQPVLIPESDVRVEVIERDVPLVRGVKDFIQGFKITAPNGVNYFFGITANPSDVDPIETSDVAMNGADVKADGIISSWFLHRVESADGLFSIDLTYESEHYAYHGYSTGGMLSHGANSASAMKTAIKGVRLASIQFSNGHVQFVPDQTPRQDLTGYLPTGFDPSPNTEAMALDQIRIESDLGYCKTYDFTYDYFRSPPQSIPNFSTFISPFMHAQDELNDDRRLKLERVREYDCSGVAKKPPYVFDYLDEFNVPRRISFAQDHWGYNNGATANDELVPELGADRESRWPHMRAGTLYRIQYPTGGSTTFTYEPNVVNTVEESNCDLQVGGELVTLVAGFDDENPEYSDPFSLDVETPGYFHYELIEEGDGSGWIELNSTKIAETGEIPVADFVYLNKGVHVFRVYANSDQFGGGGVRAVISEGIGGCDQQLTPRIVGGLRVAKITQITDAEEVIARTFEYDEANLYGIPVYKFAIKNEVILRGFSEQSGGCWINTANQSAIRAVISTGNVHPLITTQGSHIGYNSVKEVLADGGYTQHEFAGITVLPPQWRVLEDIAVTSIEETECLPSYSQYPPPPLPHDFVRGNLRRQAVYRSDGQILSETLFEEAYEETGEFTRGMKTASIQETATTYLPTHYELKTTRKLWEKQTQRTYDQLEPTAFMETESATFYESQYHQMPTTNTRVTPLNTEENRSVYVQDLTQCKPVCDHCAEVFYQSEADVRAAYESNVIGCNPTICADFRGLGSQLPVFCVNECDLAAWFEYQYAMNELYIQYSSCMRSCVGEDNCLNAGLSEEDPEVRVLYQLDANNQIGSPLEATTIRNGLVLGSTHFVFEADENDPTNVYLKEMFTIAPEAPVPDFAPMQISNGQLQFDPSYQQDPEITLNYENGQIVERTDRSGITTSYIWGFNYTLPVVQAVNTDYQTLNNAYQADPANVRRHADLSQAQITTYDYEPLVGMKQQVDPNGFRMTYHYDELGRLIQIRDLEDNVIQEFKYHYTNNQD